MCELCEREGKVKGHHLIPRAISKVNSWEGDKINVCNACHRGIHSFFSHRQLASSYNTLHKLKQQKKLMIYVKYCKQKGFLNKMPSKFLKQYRFEILKE